MQLPKGFWKFVSFLMWSLVNVSKGPSAKNVKSQKVICNFYTFEGRSLIVKITFY